MMNPKSAVKVKHAEQLIEMNTTFAKMIENPMSDEYAFLQKLKMENPGFKVCNRKIKSNPNKDTYKGLTYAYMRSYIITHETEATRVNVLHDFDELILISQCHGKRLRYPTIKKWFLAKYPEVAKFGVDTAEQEENKEDTSKSQNVVPFSSAKTAEENTPVELDEAV